MRLRIAEAVEVEIAEVFDYYQSQSLGLGLRMAAEVRAAIHKILDYPDAQTRLDARHRRRNLVKFPYALFFRATSDQVTIVGFFHQRSDPSKWAKLLGSR